MSNSNRTSKPPSAIRRRSPLFTERNRNLPKRLERRSRAVLHTGDRVRASRSYAQELRAQMH